MLALPIVCHRPISPTEEESVFPIEEVPRFSQPLSVQCTVDGRINKATVELKSCRSPVAGHEPDLADGKTGSDDVYQNFILQFLRQQGDSMLKRFEVQLNAVISTGQVVQVFPWPSYQLSCVE